VRSSSLYRKYNDDVPQYLRDRPRRLIDDLRKKMASVETSIIGGIQMKSDGVFIVPARGGRPAHEVVFGDESTCCSCTCMSFQRTQLLCIHFCAVFRAMPEWSFDRVSPIYTQSPLLTLDEDILQVGTSSLQTSEIVASERRMAIPNRLKLLKSEQEKARSLLQNMIELTYSINDVDMIQNLVQCLEPMHKDLSESLSPQPVTDESVSDGATPHPMDSGKRKCKIQFKRYVLPQKKRVLEYSPQVLEVHVIDGSNIGDVTASGPTFTV